MKKLLLTVVSIMFAATSFAQNALVASLSHGTTIKYFYGVNALQQAVEAAASGDIINLSEGIFGAANIDKAITLRGAGIDIESPTYINGEFSIEIPSTDTRQLTMEGITCQNKVTLKGSFNSPCFVKNQIQQIAGYDETDAVKNITIVNCKVLDGVGVKGTSSVFLVNSFSGDISRTETATVTATNCVLYTYVGSGRFDNAQLYNCILSAPYGSPESVLSETCQAVNCVSTRVNGRYYGNIFHTGCINCVYDAQGIINNVETFELTDEAKESFKGTDGTEVGIYGGMKPYNPTPSYPIISSLTADSQTDEDGGLNNVKVIVSNPK